MIRKKVIKALKLLSVWIVLILVFGELGVRLFVDLPEDYHDEKTTCFRFDDRLGWMPKENAECTHEASVSMDIAHNADGFRDRTHDRSSKKKSIAFLGDSFVWGYDVKEKERFTNDIQAFLPEWDIYNLGVSGFGTDQEFLLLQEWFPIYQPDLVVLVVHSNDAIDNATNYRDNYYKPYYAMEDDSLSLKGVPVPTCYRYQQQQSPILFKSHFYRALALLYNHLFKPAPIEVPNLQEEIITAMHHYLQARGSSLRIIYTYADWQPEEDLYLDSLNIPYQHLPTKHKFEEYGQHWTKEGHDHISAKLLERLFIDGVISEEDIEKHPVLD